LKQSKKKKPKLIEKKQGSLIVKKSEGEPRSFKLIKGKDH